MNYSAHFAWCTAARYDSRLAIPKTSLLNGWLSCLVLSTLGESMGMKHIATAWPASNCDIHCVAYTLTNLTTYSPSGLGKGFEFNRFKGY